METQNHSKGFGRGGIWTSVCFKKSAGPAVCRGQEREQGELQRGSCPGLGDRMGAGPLVPFTAEFTDVKQGVGEERKTGGGSGQPSGKYFAHLRTP